MNRGRSLVRAAVLVSIVLGALLSFLWLWLRSGMQVTRKHRARWLHRECKSALRRMGVKLVVGDRLPRRGLIVSNHLSYLDILIFSAALPCVFVSKSEVRSWPLLGMLAQIGGTIFVERDKRSKTPQVRNEMEEALQEGIPVTLFPEGTSSDGAGVLPFRSALFEPAIRLNLTVTPACIGYAIEGGTVGTDVCYWGDMTLVPHLFKMLSKGTVTARILFSSHPTIYRNRKEAARLARAEVVKLAEEAARVPA